MQEHLSGDLLASSSCTPILDLLERQCTMSHFDDVKTPKEIIESMSNLDELYQAQCRLHDATINTHVPLTPYMVIGGLLIKFGPRPHWILPSEATCENFRELYKLSLDWGGLCYVGEKFIHLCRPGYSSQLKLELDLLSQNPKRCTNWKHSPQERKTECGLDRLTTDHRSRRANVSCTETSSSSLADYLPPSNITPRSSPALSSGHSTSSSINIVHIEDSQPEPRKKFRIESHSPSVPAPSPNLQPKLELTPIITETRSLATSCSPDSAKPSTRNDTVNVSVSQTVRPLNYQSLQNLQPSRAMSTSGNETRIPLSELRRIIETFERRQPYPPLDHWVIEDVAQYSINTLSKKCNNYLFETKKKTPRVWYHVHLGRMLLELSTRSCISSAKNCEPEQLLATTVGRDIASVRFSMAIANMFNTWPRLYHMKMKMETIRKSFLSWEREINELDKKAQAWWGSYFED